MRQQENINPGHYHQRYPDFIKLPYQQQVWISDLLLDLRDRCEAMLSELTVATAQQRAQIIDDIKFALNRRHGVEERLMSLLFEKLDLSVDQISGHEQSRVMRAMLESEAHETVERLLAKQLLRRFYQNLRDNHVLARQRSPRFFMEVRRSRASSDERIEAWIDNAEQTFGTGVARRLRDSRGDLLVDYHGLLQHQVAGFSHAPAVMPKPTPTQQSVQEESDSTGSEGEELLFSFS